MRGATDRPKSCSLRHARSAGPAKQAPAAPTPRRQPRASCHSGSPTRLLLRTRRPPQIVELGALRLVGSGSSSCRNPGAEANIEDHDTNVPIERRPYGGPLNGLHHPPMGSVATSGLLGIKV